MSNGMKVVVGIAGGIVLAGLIGVILFFALFYPVHWSWLEPATTRDNAGMANPAAVHCEEHGGTVEIRATAGGDQYGVCVFADGRECDEWAFFWGECRAAE